MEYNINSDGVGFKAQSYFVPGGDATAKENITEYTYDRLQRGTRDQLHCFMFYFSLFQKVALSKFYNCQKCKFMLKLK